MSGIYGNRGGRGWQAPPRKRAPRTEEEVLERLAEHATAQRSSDAIIDMVQVNGVWMTREDRDA